GDNDVDPAVRIFLTKIIMQGRRHIFLGESSGIQILRIVFNVLVAGRLQIGLKSSVECCVPGNVLVVPVKDQNSPGCWGLLSDCSRLQQYSNPDASPNQSDHIESGDF